MKKSTKTLIISIASVALLTGAFLGVYFLLPDQSENNENSLDPSTQSGAEETHQHITLISHDPADITKMEVKNEKGEFTVLAETPIANVTNSAGESSQVTESTIYTIVGYEDKEQLQGSPDMLAADAAAITAEKIVDDGSSKSDFGFDEPRSTVSVEYKDGTKATIKVGDDAPDSLGTYVMVNDDKNVYLVSSDATDGFMIGVMNMMSNDIGRAADDDSQNIFTKMILGGTHYGDGIEFGYADKNKYSETYMITAPDRLVADEENVSYIFNNVRSLTAYEVMAVDATEEDIKKYELEEPYATLTAEYPDLQVDYKASKPTTDGYYYLLTNNNIYKMTTDSSPWVINDYENCISENILNPKLEYVSSITLKGSGIDYKFDISAEAAEEGNVDQTPTINSVKLNGKEIDTDKFSSYYTELTGAKRCTGVVDMPSGRESILRIEYTFKDGSMATADYYTAENRKCPVMLNGAVTLTAYESYVTGIIEQTKKLAEH